MAEVGEVLNGRYEILDEIGRGGMAAVYLAVDREKNQQWAIKEISKTSDDAGKRALEEASIMRSLDHPLIPHIEDVLENDTSLCIIIDYLPGRTLEEVLREQGPVGWITAAQIGIQLCDVLSYLHTRPVSVIYRDLKPANIMLLNHEPVAIRLVDFGIASMAGMTDDTPMGTRGFAAPEQFRRDQSVDIRADIYSLGATLYCLAAGRPPAVDSQKFYAGHRDVPLLGDFGEVIQKCMQERPEDRYQSCADVQEALEECLRYGSMTDVLAGTDLPLDEQDDRTVKLEKTAPLEEECRQTESLAERARRKLGFRPDLKILVYEANERI